MVDINLVGK